MIVNVKDYEFIFGKNGFVDCLDKVEGDKKTPTGTFKVTEVYFREDKLKIDELSIISLLSKKIKTLRIEKEMLWCDDVSSPFYNMLVSKKDITIKGDQGKDICKSYEHMYRDDDLYDIVLVLDYNLNPVISGKGSAIFVHIWGSGKRDTDGCIAFKKATLLKILSGFLMDDAEKELFFAINE